MKKSVRLYLSWICVLALIFSALSPSFSGAEAVTNLALNKPAVATFEQIGTGDDSYNAYASNAVDGDLSSRWSSYGGPGLPQAIQIDLGAKCTLSRLVIYWFGNGRSFTFDAYLTDKPVVVSQSIESGFTPVLEKQTGTGSGDGSAGQSGSKASEYQLPDGSEGRYLTIKVTGVSSGTAAVIWEIEAYGVQIGEAEPSVITKVSGFTNRYVPVGTAIADIELPKKATATLDSGETAEFSLEWSCEEYDPSVPGEYEFKGVPVIEKETKVINPDGLYASLTVTVTKNGEYLAGRQTYNICSDWKFKKGSISAASQKDFDDSRWEGVSIPHTWNALDGQDGGNNYYRGEGWYRKTLAWDAAYENKRIYIEFLGAGSQAEMYVNGSSVGTHKGAYTAFRFDITDALVPGQDNVLAVKVNNANAQEIAPVLGGGPMFDFTLFGGIYRGVSLVVTDPVHADTLDYGSSGLKLTPTNVSEKSADLNIKSTIVNDSDAEKTVTVKAVLKDPDAFEEVEGITPLFDVSTMYGGSFRMETEETITIPAGGSVVFSKDLTVQNPRLWNGKEDPYRYQVDLTVTGEGKTLDTLTQYVGFRYYAVDYDKGFFLNGESYPLRGVSRHQDRENMGSALTEKEHSEDFALIYEIGANSVRLAHYPQAPYFYELCDKYGIVAWAEIPFVNIVGGSGSYENPDANRKAFFETTKQQLTELIRQQYNRPSICFWGLQNEVLAFEECMPEFMSELNALAHAEDPTRLTTQATDKDAANGWETDLLAWNSYPGWYFGTKDDMGSYFDGKHAADSRPIAVSEYGAGANIEHHVVVATDADKNIGKFQAEEYQSLCHESIIRQINERPYLWATYVWNMFDFSCDWRSEGGLQGINTKGLVSRDRTVKKDAFYLYKANWSSEPAAYIAGRRNDVRKNALNQIKVYSNCESVELSVNGKVISRLTKDDLAQRTVFIFEDVPLATGENTVAVKAVKNGSTYTDSVIWEKVVGTGTDIKSDTLVVDSRRKAIELNGKYTAEEFLGLIVSASNAAFKLYEADGKTEVTSGPVSAGMVLIVTSEDGSNTAVYSILNENIAKGKAITASSYQNKEDGVYPIANANDGDTSTRWAAGYTASGITEYPQSVTVDLGKAYSLSRIDIDWFTGGSKSRNYYYTVSVSDSPDDGYVKVVDRSANTEVGAISDSLGEITARYVRIDVTGNSEYANNKTTAASLYEIYIYGHADEEETPTPGVLLGDVDDDGKITVSDVVELRRLIVAGEYTQKQFEAGNLDGDEGVSVSDVVELRRLIVKGS